MNDEMNNEINEEMNDGIKPKKGISLGLLILILSIIVILSVVIIVFIINITNNDKTSENTNNTIEQSDLETNKNDDFNIDALKEEDYPNIFGATKLPLATPQSYVLHTKFNINPNNNKKFVVKSIHHEINSRSPLKFYYIISADEKISIELYPGTSKIEAKYVSLINTIDGVDIYGNENDSGIIYVPILGSEGNYTLHIRFYKGIKTDIIPEILECINIENIHISSLDPRLGIKVSSEYMRQTINDITFDFNNVKLTKWALVENDGEKPEISISYVINSYPVKIHTGNYGIDYIKTDLENENKIGTLFSYELEEMNIDGKKYYVEKSIKNDGTILYSTIYIENGNHLITIDPSYTDYSSGYDVHTIDIVSKVFKEQVLNKVLFYE